jgi:uncharacterized protein
LTYLDLLINIMSVQEYYFHFKEQHLILVPQKVIFWKEESALILSDLHLGKTAHFRKAGIALPSQVIQEDLFRLQQLIIQFQPEKIILVGDLFHSEKNQDVAYFKLWRQQFPHIAFLLVKGNHDILQKELYADLQIQLHDQLYLQPFLFIHDKNEPNLPSSSAYYITGHLHPGMLLKGRGKQRLTLPCFYFGEKAAILPAFGQFTGLALIEKNEGEKVFAITGDSVLLL